MQCAQGVVKARVIGARIHIVGQAQLSDSAQALKIRMLNQVKYQLVGNRDESVNRIVENLVFVEGRQAERI